MSQDKSKPLNEFFVVTRNIPIRLEGGSLAAVAERLQTQSGIVTAGVSDTGCIKIRYDTSRIGFNEIEQLLDESGAARPASLVWRIKSGWFCFTDNNARANAHATHACCSKPPVPPGGGHK